MELPPSREVRLEDGVTHGEAERIAFQIYKGDAGSLANSIIEIELVMERDRSRTIDAFAATLKKKLQLDGYIVMSDIDQAAENWHQEEILGLEHGRAYGPNGS